MYVSELLTVEMPMPTEHKGKSWWFSFPNMITHCLTILILVLGFSVTLVISFNRTNELQQSVKSMQNEVAADRGINAERDKSSRDRDRQIIDELRSSSKKNAAIEATLNNIWNGLIETDPSIKQKSRKR